MIMITIMSQHHRRRRGYTQREAKRHLRKERELWLKGDVGVQKWQEKLVTAREGEKELSIE